MEKEKGLMSVEEAADYLGVKRSTLYSWVFYRKIPFIKIGRLVKFDYAELQQWIDEKRRPYVE